MTEANTSIIERVVKVERDVAVCGREISELKQKIESQSAILQQLQSMNANIAVLAEQVKQLAKTTAKLDQRLDAVEGRPAKRWDAIVAAVITGLVGVAIGYFVK